MPEGGPPLHIDIRFQHASGADDHVFFNDAELADADARPDDGVGMNTSGRRDLGGGMDGHCYVSRSSTASNSLAQFGAAWRTRLGLIRANNSAACSVLCS